MKTIRYGIMLLACTMFLPAFANEVPHSTCEDAPDSAVTVLPEPFNTWTRIVCLPGRGHWLTPPKGRLWRKPDPHMDQKKPTGVVFSSIGRRSYKSNNKHLGYFQAAKIFKDNARDFVYGLWPEGLPTRENNKKYEVVHQIVIVSNTGDSYALHFFMKNTSPEWLLSCHDTSPDTFCHKATLARITPLPTGIDDITISIAE